MLKLKGHALNSEMALSSGKTAKKHKKQVNYKSINMTLNY